ncbi:unnamed protein product [Vitrella brassicaformis CCMP3155]|uniref:Photosystem II Psb27 protein n=2 Tax=Vitrella brassicaformis TaxID=1169539 RepID=A0A0G4GUF4_VITBC|nr:unnamed protein product [Vitrella brassicaformis CCMP3155]|eukprot:CEM34402.1 unnamed protein product [Vitrella brassicaformis CCMP3155]
MRCAAAVCLVAAASVGVEGFSVAPAIHTDRRSGAAQPSLRAARPHTTTMGAANLQEGTASTPCGRRSVWVERAALTGLASIMGGLPLILTQEEALAQEAAAPVAPPPAVPVYEKGPKPEVSEFGISKKNYKDDARQVLNHMKYATLQVKGDPDMELINEGLKKEMTDFFSYYRRFNAVSGRTSFSNMYTAINVMAGHYQSYGYKVPLPEKRRKRLMQEFAMIERDLNRGR